MVQRILSSFTTLVGILLLLNSAGAWASLPPIPPPGASSPQSYKPNTGTDIDTITHHGGSFDTTPVDHTGTEDDTHHEYNPVQSKQYQGPQPIHKGF